MSTRRRLITLLLVLLFSLFSSHPISSKVKQSKADSIPSQNIEQKRRQAIREGFDRLTELVPGLEGQGRSESVVLKKTVDYMRAQLAERRRLCGRIEELGGRIDESMRR